MKIVRTVMSMLVVVMSAVFLSACLTQSGFPTFEKSCGTFKSAAGTATEPNTPERAALVTQTVNNLGICKAALKWNLQGVTGLSEEMTAQGINGGIVDTFVDVMNQLSTDDFNRFAQLTEGAQFYPTCPAGQLCTVEDWFELYGVTVETGLIPMKQLWKLEIVRIVAVEAVPSQYNLDEELEDVVYSHLLSPSFDGINGSQIFSALATLLVVQ